jgi:hypothetical protein
LAGRSGWIAHAAASLAVGGTSGRSAGAGGPGRSCRMARKFGTEPGRFTHAHIVTISEQIPRQKTDPVAR